MHTKTIQPRFATTKALSRTLLVIGAVMVLAGGITFAVLQSQRSTLAGNSISTGNASLKISTNGTDFGANMAGLSYNDLIPGVPSASKQKLYIKNNGTIPIAPTLSMANGLENTGTIDISKTYLLVTPSDSTDTKKIAFSDLIDRPNSTPYRFEQAVLAPGETKSYTLQMLIDSDAVKGEQAGFTKIDFNIDGTAAN